MLHGDISNKIGETIAIQCIGTLMEKAESNSLKDRVFNILSIQDKHKINPKKLKVNKSVKSMMDYIYRSTDMCIDLVVWDKDYSERFANWLEEHMPFNRILVVKKPSQIGSRLILGDITYYVDNDAEVRNLINSRYAVPFNRITDIIRKHR